MNVFWAVILAVGSIANVKCTGSYIIVIIIVVASNIAHMSVTQ